MGLSVIFLTAFHYAIVSIFSFLAICKMFSISILKSKENDPNRLFLNRGGALLKEMKTRNTVQKGLPKVKNNS